ncbi:ATP-binding cassette domain-containing protein [Rubrimonas cliftonensis]|uniref:NitT/TauT family transport system ATP-binding protein/putative spermidine/putrescine transport system ATP-binding protein n=1 Tax=Rubrimonas cliftonensis TaxID=89524 RepID=A0A1H3VJ79_9RHOB|nr:ATP-binding cassette domain-containing protein [Rubrimonas cliftonensis]SDZ74731.1 NitT/TauT family transport system ATP-binding protein/putative spermidine/putrescine transport system ATP-binding protein [Rubrimonas cliftonensis]
MSYLAFDAVEKRYGEMEAMARFDLAVAEGEFVAFLGPSGCGKTTLMRMVGGLEAPSARRIRLRGEMLTRPDRRRGMVFQSYSAFPWLNEAGNVAYGMLYRRDLTAAEKRARGALPRPRRSERLRQQVPRSHIGRNAPERRGEHDNTRRP